MKVYQELTPDQIEDSDTDWKPDIPSKYCPKWFIGGTRGTAGAKTRSRL